MDRYFPSFRIDVLDGEPFDLCSCGVDWGIRNPAAAVLVVRLLSGCYYAVNEVYERETDAVTFAGMVRRMLELEGVVGCPVWIDASTFNRVDGLFCVAERFVGVGLNVIPATRDRETSMLMIRDLLGGGKLVISPACRRLIGELRRFGKFSSSDHAIDALRYAIYPLEVHECSGVV